MYTKTNEIDPSEIILDLSCNGLLTEDILLKLLPDDSRIKCGWRFGKRIGQADLNWFHFHLMNVNGADDGYFAKWYNDRIENGW